MLDPRGLRCPSVAVAVAVYMLSAALSASTSAGEAVVESPWAWKEGREDVARVVRGDIDGALKSLDRQASRLPPRAEICFVRVLAHAQRGDRSAALAEMRRALDLGLPPERFLAGPRELLAELRETEEFERLVARRCGPMVHGPLLGSVTSSSARFWVRTVQEADVRVRVGALDGEARSRRDRDFTAVVEVTGLAPSTRHVYRIEVDGRPVNGEWAFLTFPVEGSPARFEVAFGGGASYNPGYERMFDTVRKRSPLAFLQLGDNVYIDHPRHPAVQRYCYYRRQSSPPYRALTASRCVASIWDDHDFGTDDCQGGPALDQPPWKRKVWEVFRENWNNPGWGGGEARPGCWYDFRIGDVHFLMLDGRTYRTAPGVDAPSMLGPEQKRWLLERLRNSRATFKVIASPVPFAPGTKPGSRDTWDGYAAEREEIFAWIETHRVGGVVLIAADRHRSDAWRIERPGAYDLYEFMSSRLTNRHTHRVLDGALFGYNEDRSFGLLSFDTTKEDPEVRYTIVTVDDEPVWSISLRRSQLGYRERS